jgi:integrase
MKAIVDFAIASARREAETCRLEWRDNNAATRTGLVRDAKHPTSKDGNHRRFKYTSEAWAIVENQPRTSACISPYDPKSVGAAFTRACHVLGIEDLRFHDLHHEATSRLFERGYQIHEVAQFTLHESWNELKRPTNLKPESVRELKAPEALAALRSRGRQAIVAPEQPPSRAVRQSTRRDRPH